MIIQNGFLVSKKKKKLKAGMKEKNDFKMTKAVDFYQLLEGKALIIVFILPPL